MPTILSLLLFAGLLFGVALLTNRRRDWPAAPALAMLGSFGALGYFGLAEMAGRYGLSALLAFMAFSVVFLFGPLVMRPVQWAAQTRRLPTLADLFSYRYRSKEIGPLVTITLALSCLPLIAGQLQMAGTALWFSSANSTDFNLSAPQSAALFCLVIALFLWCYGHNSRQKLLHALAIGSLIMLVALLVNAVWACLHTFGGPVAMEHWANRSGQSSIVHRFNNSYSLISLFLIASLTLPHIYHQQARFPTRRQSDLTGWLFPLLLLLGTLAMFPLLWSGLAEQLKVPLQLFLPALSTASDSYGLNILVTLGGLFACAGVTITVTQALTTMVVHHFSFIRTGNNTNLYRQLTTQRRNITVTWLGLALIASQLISTDSITTLSLVAFVGAAQLAPGLLSALYVPILNQRGITAGLIVGVLLWALGLLLPLFVGSWRWSPFEGFNINFGIASWSNWLQASLAANFSVSLLVSRLSATSRKEALYARACMIDKVAVPQRIAPHHCDLEQVQRKLSEHIGKFAAQRELHRSLPDNPAAMRPFEWRELRSKLVTNLYQLLGVTRAEQIVNQVLPLTTDTNLPQQDLRSIESLLAGRQNELYGLAAELNKLHLHHRQILHGLPLGTCSLDQDNEMTLWNSALEEITGVASDTAIGAHLSTLPSPWREVLSKAAGSNSSHQFAIEVADGDRKLWFNLHKSVVQYHDNPSAEQVILLEDVTDALSLTQEMAHTERLASVGRLAAGVAHEIGNPVTGIACLAQDIRAGVDDTEQQQSADMILTQVDRITRIVRSLIDFSRSGNEGNMQMQDVPLSEPLQQALQLLALQKEQPAVNFQIDIPDNLPVRGDPHQLVQVFLNLLSNARDASDSKGPVTIAARQAGSFAEITITDNGVGIAADKLDKVLEPFFTTKQAGEGTGLGLSLVYNMVRSYGGDMSLQSPVADNRGTRVTVRLPLASHLPTHT